MDSERQLLAMTGEDKHKEMKPLYFYKEDIRKICPSSDTVIPPSLSFYKAGTYHISEENLQLVLEALGWSTKKIEQARAIYEMFENISSDFERRVHLYNGIVLVATIGDHQNGNIYHMGVYLWDSETESFINQDDLYTKGYYFENIVCIGER